MLYWGWRKKKKTNKALLENMLRKKINSEDHICSDIDFAFNTAPGRINIRFFAM